MRPQQRGCMVGGGVIEGSGVWGDGTTHHWSQSCAALEQSGAFPYLCTGRHTHTDTHAHGQTYIHMCTCIGDTWTHSHNTICTHTHSDTHITQMYMQYTHTYTLGQTRHHPHTCTSIRTERHTCIDTCAQANTDAHMSLTHTRTHTYAQTPAQGMMMPFALGWKVLGTERQRNGGWGSETSVFLSVESPQHLGAGTREEQ